MDIDLVQRFETLKKCRFDGAPFEEGNHKLFIVFVSQEGTSDEDAGGGDQTD